MPKTADQLKWEGDGARICCQHQWQESWVINEARSCKNLCSFPMKWTHNKKAQNRPLVVNRTRQPEVASSRLHLLWPDHPSLIWKYQLRQIQTQTGNETFLTLFLVAESYSILPITCQIKSRVGKKCYKIKCETCPNQMWNMSSHSCELCSGGLSKKWKQEAGDTWEEQEKLTSHSLICFNILQKFNELASLEYADWPTNDNNPVLGGCNHKLHISGWDWMGQISGGGEV